MEVVIPRSEYWDAEKEEFIYTKGQVIKIEHSLLSIRRCIRIAILINNYLRTANKRKDR